MAVTALELTTRNGHTRSTSGVLQTVATVGAVDEAIAVVVATITAAFLERRRRDTFNAPGSTVTKRVITIGEAVAVVVEPVVAGLVLGHERRNALAFWRLKILAGAGYFVAEIVGTLITVVAVDGAAREAAARGTKLATVTKKPIVTEAIVRRDVAAAHGLRTLVHGALNAIVAQRWLAALAKATAAGLSAVTSKSIVALDVTRAADFNACCAVAKLPARAKR